MIHDSPFSRVSPSSGSLSAGRLMERTCSGDRVGATAVGSRTFGNEAKRFAARTCQPLDRGGNTLSTNGDYRPSVGSASCRIRRFISRGAPANRVQRLVEVRRAGQQEEFRSAVSIRAASPYASKRQNRPERMILWKSNGAQTPFADVPWCGRWDPGVGVFASHAVGDGGDAARGRNADGLQREHYGASF